MSIRVDINARRLDDRVLLQQRVDTQDDDGSIVETWVDVVNLYASVERNVRDQVRTFVGREDEVAGQKKTLSPYSVTIRWRRGLVPGMTRLKWHDKDYGIDRILNIVDNADRTKRGRFMLMYCEEGFSENGQ